MYGARERGKERKREGEALRSEGDKGSLMRLTIIVLWFYIFKHKKKDCLSQPS